MRGPTNKCVSPLLSFAAVALRAIVLHEGHPKRFTVKPSTATETNRLYIQWTVDWAGDGWNFRSLSTGKYISLGGAEAANGARLVAETDPFTWHIWTDEEVEGAYR